MSTSRRRKAPARQEQRRKAVPARDFWGPDQPDTGDDPAAGVRTVIRPGEHPSALVRSLGPLPFPRADVAPHYFDAVYERAAALALALAASAGLMEVTDAG